MNSYPEDVYCLMADGNIRGSGGGGGDDGDAGHCWQSTEGGGADDGMVTSVV